MITYHLKWEVKLRNLTYPNIHKNTTSQGEDTRVDFRDFWCALLFSVSLRPVLPLSHLVCSEVRQPGFLYFVSDGLFILHLFQAIWLHDLSKLIELLFFYL